MRTNRLLETFFVAFCEGLASTISGIFFPNNIWMSGAICGSSAIFAIVIWELFFVRNKDNSERKYDLENKSQGDFTRVFLNKRLDVFELSLFPLIIIGTIVGLIFCSNLAYFDKSLSQRELGMLSGGFILVSCGMGGVWAIATQEMLESNLQKKGRIKIVIGYVVLILIASCFLYNNAILSLVLYILYMVGPFWFLFLTVFED